MDYLFLRIIVSIGVVNTFVSENLNFNFILFIGGLT